MSSFSSVFCWHLSAQACASDSGGRRAFGRAPATVHPLPGGCPFSLNAFRISLALSACVGGRAGGGSSGVILFFFLLGICSVSGIP